MEQVLTVSFPYLVLDRRVATCPDIELIILIFSVHIRIVVLVVSRVTTKQVMACDRGNNPQLENQASFISIIGLKEYPVILEKSNIPSIKNKRNRAIEEIQNRIDNELGLHLDSSQILKKFNNIKSRVKADTNKTGNKKVILKPWEEELLNFIEGDTDNPAIVRLKGAVTAGTEETQHENSVSFDSSVDSTNFETSSDKTIENRQGKTQDSTAEQHKVTGPNVKQAKKNLN
ncbi:hypothetical protein J6590_103580 [Homalodisca vitripennis]|nr:hypothetical protein J6590_103580 [Homalodisca vitripennis]